ncbi:prepilin-type N-terminal cleavage/methylation domain-containing protein [Candidatus Microgenomates bacterium]|nr:prepilin-type N-terminal cleavage/methylation domain-containing protein [Candidatus Microgenomates bacterium]
MPNAKCQMLNKGFTLVELIAALGVAAIIVLALINLTTTSISNVSFSQTQSNANRDATAVMEFLRATRNANWDNFAGKTGTWCFSAPPFPTPLAWPATGGSCISSSLLAREIKLTTVSDSEIDAEVRVFWADSKGTHETKLSSKFTKY